MSAGLERQRPRLCNLREAPFERLVGLAARSLGVESAFLAFAPRWRVRGSHGLEPGEAQAYRELIAGAAKTQHTVWIEDARLDLEFRQQPWTSCFPQARFAAAEPLISSSGRVLAVLCVSDPEPRAPTEDAIAMLRDFGHVALNEWHLRLKAVKSSSEMDCCMHARQMALQFAGQDAMPFELRMSAEGAFRFPMFEGPVESMLGFAASKLKSDASAFFDRIHPDDRPSFESTLRLSADTLEPWVWDGRIESAMGLTEWLHVSTKPRREKGGVYVWHGTFLRVTEHKQAEIAYRNSYLWLEQAVQERTRALRQSQEEMLLRLGRAAEYRDGETGAHIARMSRYCATIGRHLGLPEEECELLMNASTMHDIGKIGVSDAVLHKNGGLDGTEWAHMKAHVDIGSQLLSGGSSKLVKAAEIIARTHHERWDGSGYPNHLCGKEIPLYGRVAAIADVFDALTSQRPYKTAWTPEEAVAEIKGQAGRHFDPAIVEVFLRALPDILEVMRSCQSEDDVFEKAA